MSEAKDPIEAMVEAMSASDSSSIPDENVQDEVTKTVEAVTTDVEVDEDDDSTVPKSVYKKEIAGKAKLREQRRQLRSQVEELQAELAKLKGGSEAPDILDFENADDYDKALKEHEKQKASSSIPDVVVKARATLLDQHDEWVDAPSDWMEVVTRDDLPYDSEMLAMFADLDNGAEVMYALAKDEKALSRIMSKISAVNRGMALSKFASELSQVDEQKAPVNSMGALNRQKPGVSAIAPVGGSARGKTSIESWSVEDHIAAARKTSSF